MLLNGLLGEILKIGYFLWLLRTCLSNFIKLLFTRGTRMGLLPKAAQSDLVMC